MLFYLNYTYIILITYITLSFTSIASAQVTAERVLPEQGYLPGQTIVVEINLQNEFDTVQECIVKEIPPQGWVISRINKDLIIDGVIQWSLQFRRKRTIQYWLTIPEETDGVYEFGGTVNDQPISGHSVIEPYSPVPIGLFSGNIDIIGKGEPLGNAFYDPTKNEYEVIGGNYINFESLNEDGHILFKEVWGDVTITSKIRPIQMVSSNQMAGVALGFFDSFGAQCKFFLERFYAQEPVVETVWRINENKDFSFEYKYLDFEDTTYEAKVVRQDDQCFSYYRYSESDEWILHQSKTILFSDPILVVLMARPLDTRVLCKGYFSDVKIEQSITQVNQWELY